MSEAIIRVGALLEQCVQVDPFEYWTGPYRVVWVKRDCRCTSWRAFHVHGDPCDGPPHMHFGALQLMNDDNYVQHCSYYVERDGRVVPMRKADDPAPVHKWEFRLAQKELAPEASGQYAIPF